MAGQGKMRSWAVWMLGVAFALIVVLWMLSIKGIIPLTYTNARTPAELVKFLDSRRDDMRGIKVNGHFLEIGKRPSLQIIREYREPMYLMRPYRQVKLMSRSLTRPEVLDFCSNVSWKDFEGLKSQVRSGKGFTVAWSGNVEGRDVQLVKATLFSYLVLGLSDRPMFLTQVELSKRFGMHEDRILSRIIPVQKKWYDEFASSPSARSPYPVRHIPPVQDELVTWLNERVLIR